MAIKTTKYTNGGGDRDPTNAANYNNGAPATGDTVQYDNTESDLSGATLPTAHTGNPTLNIEVLADYVQPLLSAFAASATLGATLLNSASADILVQANAGTVTVTAGIVSQDTSATVSYVLNGAGAALSLEAELTLTGTITGSGGNVYVDSAVTLSTAFTTGAIVLNLDGESEWIGDVTGNVTCYADTSGPRKITGDYNVSATGTADWSIDTEDFTVDGTFTRPAGGDLTGNAGGEMIVTGNCMLDGAGGTIANAHIRMKGTGTYTSAQQWLQGLVIDATSTSTVAAGPNYTTNLEVESGGTLAGGAAATIIARRPSANGVDIAGDCTCNLKITTIVNLALSGRIATTETLTYDGRDDILAHSGVLDVGSMIIGREFTDNEYARWTATGASFSADDVTLGVSSGTNRYGILDVSGVIGAVTIGDLADVAGGSSALALGAKAVTIPASSTWDGTDIDSSASNLVTGDATSTLQDMDDPGAAVQVLGGIVDGTGNDANWVFPSDDAQPDDEKGGALRRSLQGAA